MSLQSEPWVHRLQSGYLENGEPDCVWLRQDGMGSWLVTKDFESWPMVYLTIDGVWSGTAKDSTRHTEQTARSLAVSYFLKSERHS